MKQIYRTSSRSAEPPAEPAEPVVPPAVSATGQRLDTILDDISDVLETDALTFVQSYAQEGGQ